MIYKDAAGLPFHAASDRAADLYCKGIEAFLEAQEPLFFYFEQLLVEDPQCALGLMGLARVFQVRGKSAPAREIAAHALALAPKLSPREQGHLHALASVIHGEGERSLSLIQDHLKQFPRDRFVLAPATGVFGLIGFSGREGREARLFEFLSSFESSLRGDWWFESALAFAACETGQLQAAQLLIEKSWQANSRSANCAHIRAHIDYEFGRERETFTWLNDWFHAYDVQGLMHCHLAWHLALAHLRCDEPDRAWTVYRQWVHPRQEGSASGAWGPPLNLLSDAISFLFRAELRGIHRSQMPWTEVLEVAQQLMPLSGLTFADFHKTIGFVMLGDQQALSQWNRAIHANPCVHELFVQHCAEGFGALAQGQWDRAFSLFENLPISHEVLGGSRAQRDLLAEAKAYAKGRGKMLSGRHR